MHEIIPDALFQRGEFAKFSPEFKYEELEKRGITIIANLIRNTDPDFINREPYFYFNYPIPDNKLTETDKSTLVEYAKLFAGQIKLGKKVLTHCHAGRNRSGLMSALIVMKVLGMTGKQAVEYVREKRPNALANDNFVEWLESLESL